MVLLFLRDWRSVIVVVLNIPFAICGALVALWLTGQTINLMTLGGLALAIGILVDEATVEIENIHHKMEGHPLGRLGRASGEPGHGRPAPAGDALHPGGVPAVVLHAGGGAGAVRAAVAGGRVRDGLLVPALEHVRAGALDLAASPPSPARRSRSANPVRAVVDAYGRALSRVVRWRWLVVPAYLAWPRSSSSASAKPGPGDLPEGRRRAVSAPDARADRDADRGDREAGARRARDDPEEVGADDVEISIGYVGLIPSSYPINAIYQWTGGPEEVVLRVALKEGTTVAIEGLKERLRTDPRREDARGAVLVRAGRHRQRGHELRLADPRGVHGQRPEPRREPGLRREGPCGAERRFRRFATSSSARRSTTRP